MASQTPTDQQPEAAVSVLTDGQLALRQWRYDAAREANLNPFQAIAFAESRADIGHLRNLAAAGYSANEIVDWLFF